MDRPNVQMISKYDKKLFSFWIDRLGRKPKLMIVNIPLTIAWIMMYNAQTIWEIFMANALLGLAIGLIQRSVSTFIGEVRLVASRCYCIIWAIIMDLATSVRNSSPEDYYSPYNTWIVSIDIVHYVKKSFENFQLFNSSEPSHQSFFMKYTSMFSTVGMLFVFILNTLIPWRTAGLVCMFVPILSLIALFFVRFCFISFIFHILFLFNA